MFSHTILLILAVVAVAAFAEDEVSHAVGTRKFLELTNNFGKQAAWEMVLEPGDYAPYHVHVKDYMFYIQEGSEMAVLDEKNNTVMTFVAEAGTVMAFKLMGDELVEVNTGLRFPAGHGATNIGTTRFKEILFEYYDPTPEQICDSSKTEL